jgi:hypothetical protein
MGTGSTCARQRPYIVFGLLYRALRQLKYIRSDVRVVLSSGYDDADGPRRFAGEGLADFILRD